jgi:hypothetical protein
VFLLDAFVFGHEGSEAVFLSDAFVFGHEGSEECNKVCTSGG